MKNPDPQSGIVKSIQPTLKLSQIFGITYFNERKQCITTTYRLFIMLSLFLCFLHEVPTIQYWLSKNKKLHAILTASETSSRWIILFVNTVVNISRERKVKEIFQELKSVSVKYGATALKRVYAVQIVLLGCDVLVLVCYMIFGHHLIWKNENKKWYTSSLYIVTEFYIAFGNVQYVSFMYLVREWYWEVNERLALLKKWIDRDEGFVVGQIRKCRESHLVLYSVSVKLNECYSLQLLLFVMLAMIEIMYSLTSLVEFMASIRVSETWSKRPLLGACHMFFWAVYYVSFLCQIIGSKKSSLLVHELLNRYPNRLVERELELFSVQIIKNDIKFSACGFFPLGFPLLHSIAAAVVAYVVAVVSLREV